MQEGSGHGKGVCREHSASSQRLSCLVRRDASLHTTAQRKAITFSYIWRHTFPAFQDLVNDVKARGKKQIYILKPDAGCQGKGIRLIQGGKEEALQKTLKEMDTMNVVAQHYLPKPFLIHGYKFDMRIYSLVSREGRDVTG